MATDTLYLKFGTLSGEKTWKFSLVKENATTANVKALVQAMIDNGSIYETPPLSAVSATIKHVTDTVYDLS